MHVVVCVQQWLDIVYLQKEELLINIFGVVLCGSYTQISTIFRINVKWFAAFWSLIILK